jgi:hypothetical protein
MSRQGWPAAGRNVEGRPPLSTSSLMFPSMSSSSIASMYFLLSKVEGEGYGGDEWTPWWSLA